MAGRYRGRMLVELEIVAEMDAPSIASATAEMERAWNAALERWPREVPALPMSHSMDMAVVAVETTQLEDGER